MDQCKGSQLPCQYSPKIDDWVADQVDVLQAKVFGDLFGDADNAPRHADTDEALRQDFITELQRAFAEAFPEPPVRPHGLLISSVL